MLFSSQILNSIAQKSVEFKGVLAYLRQHDFEHTELQRGAQEKPYSDRDQSYMCYCCCGHYCAKVRKEKKGFWVNCSK